MGLVLLAHFYERNEALIAAGALEAAGVTVFVENARQMGVQPLYEIALGGYRLMVPEEELGTALAVIEEARRNPVREGGSLTQRTYLLLSLALTLLMMVVLPFRTSRWHEVQGGDEPPARV